MYSICPYRFLIENKKSNDEEAYNSLRKILDEVFIDESSIMVLPVGTIMYRARAYWNEDVYEKHRNGVSKSQQFQGYDSDNSFVNLNVISNGRCKLSNKPVLYTSENIKASVLEIGCKRKSAVSVAEIKVKEELKLLDLREGVNVFSGDNFEKLQWLSDFKMWLTTEMSFPDKEYKLTQKISRYAFEKGYDGIAYHTTYHNESDEKTDRGCLNYAIFSYEKCEPYSSKLYLIENVDVQMKPFKEVN